jgi:hypothetical protein
MYRHAAYAYRPKEHMLQSLCMAVQALVTDCCSSVCRTNLSMAVLSVAPDHARVILVQVQVYILVARSHPRFSLPAYLELGR